MTTDCHRISAFAKSSQARLIVSTYQSSPLTPDCSQLIIFDEAHRICGDDTERAFTHALLSHTQGHNLYMTATPKFYGDIHMRNRKLFGGTAFRYHLRQAIDADFVNNFRLELVAASAPRSDTVMSAKERTEILAQQILSAMERVDKLLIFAKNIRHIRELAEAVKKASGQTKVEPFQCFVAHSQMAAHERATALKEFSRPGVRACLINCRLFAEGIEVPALNAVFFAAPRHSPIEIIQSICRSLNKIEGKPQSIVFIPVLSDPTRPLNDPLNLRRYASIVPYIDALLQEDPKLFDHLLGANRAYPLGCILTLGKYSLGDDVDGREVLRAIKKGVRYGISGRMNPSTDRLTRAENIPWERGFRELKRVVVECKR